jgi:hypothetical protein
MHYYNEAKIYLEVYSWHFIFWHIATLKQVTMPDGRCQCIFTTSGVRTEGMLLKRLDILVSFKATKHKTEASLNSRYGSNFIS